MNIQKSDIKNLQNTINGYEIMNLLHHPKVLEF